MTEYPSKNWRDYELIDCGDGEKLERFGKFTMIRPEPKAIWAKTLSDAEWQKLAHTHFTPGAGFGRDGEGYIRISAFNSRAAIVEAIARLKKVL